MKFIWTSLLIIFCHFFTSSNAFATTVDSTTIKRLMLDRSHGEVLFIELQHDQVQKISCDDIQSWQYALDVSDEMGKKMYSLILSAYAAKTTIKAIGNDQCSLHDRVETLNRIELK